MGSVGGIHSKASSRGRPYGLMLLVAFGAALLGVMLLHKLREKRICNLLLKRTGQDLHSFQFLFQREKDRSKELEKSNEDMKASLYLLRTHKMELDRRLLELQSTIDSLRDEQRIVNVALKEKQSEIQTLRDREIENPQVVVAALTQRLKQKEDELEDLRRRLESRGVDDSSDPRVDSTMSEESEPKEQFKTSSGKGGEDNESMDNNRGESKSTDFSEGRSISKKDEMEEETPKRREMEVEETKKQDDGEQHEQSKTIDDHKEEEVKDSEAVEKQRAADKIQSEMKKGTETGKYGHPRKTRGKRLRYIARKRTVDNGWRLISKKRKQEKNRNLVDSEVIREFIKERASNEEKIKDEYSEEARENLMEKENKMLKQEELNSKNSETWSEDGERKGNADMGDGSIKQNNSGEDMEIKDSKSEEKQEPELEEEDDGFNKEGNKEETEESGF